MIIRNAGEDRQRVGFLGAGRDGPDLHKSESERAEPLEVLGVLVQAGGDTERRRKVEAHRADPDQFVVGMSQGPQAPARAVDAR